jgi:hypothetical protein
LDLPLDPDWGIEKPYLESRMRERVFIAPSPSEGWEYNI